LRALETGDFEPVGSSRTRRADVRVISATNSDLQNEVASGRFRQDLLFRLNTIEIHIPPLRQRTEDIIPLTTHFLRKHAQRYRKEITGFDPTGAQLLLAHAWPGNVRELDHAVERAVLLAERNTIGATELALTANREPSNKLEDLSLEEVEAFLIQKALTRFGGNVSHAAKALGLSRSALYRRIQRYGL
jgi:DNA-binding NtrC family response regulator